SNVQATLDQVLEKNDHDRDGNNDQSQRVWASAKRPLEIEILIEKIIKLSGKEKIIKLTGAEASEENDKLTYHNPKERGGPEEPERTDPEEEERPDLDPDPDPDPATYRTPESSDEKRCTDLDLDSVYDDE
ncbi:hypothetical protein BGZ80_009112, partial [Entomortierella chlamydospora]